jgi:hypothetical protein
MVMRRITRTATKLIVMPIVVKQGMLIRAMMMMIKAHDVDVDHGGDDDDDDD